MSAKTGEAMERMALKTRKVTPSLERRVISARASSKGGSAHGSGVAGVGVSGL